MRYLTALGAALLLSACASTSKPPSRAVAGEAGADTEGSAGGASSGGAEVGGQANGGESFAASGVGAGGESSGRRLHGTLLDFVTKRPLADRRLIIGGQATKSNADGSFELVDVADVYDIEVSEADGSVLSFYFGLMRLDPVLLHRPSAFGFAGDRTARVRGELSKPGPQPLSETDSASVHFFSPLTDARILLGGAVPPHGPAYQLFLGWNGAAELSGTLLARGTFAGAGDVTRWLAVEQLQVHDGEEPVVDLTFAPVTTGRLAGNVSLPSGVVLSQLQEYYRLPFPNGVVPINDALLPLPDFDDEVDDLSGIGAQLCVAALSDDSGALVSERCGIPLGSHDVSLTLQPAPTLAQPRSGAALSVATQFAWSSFEQGVHLLSLEVGTATSSSPNIYVYTVATEIPWSALSELGVEIASANGYQCTIAGLGPFDSLDHAASAAGLGALIPSEMRMATSAPIELAATP